MLKIPALKCLPLSLVFIVPNEITEDRDGSDLR